MLKGIELAFKCSSFKQRNVTNLLVADDVVGTHPGIVQRRKEENYIENM